MAMGLAENHIQVQAQAGTLNVHIFSVKLVDYGYWNSSHDSPVKRQRNKPCFHRVDQPKCGCIQPRHKTGSMLRNT